MSVDKSKSIVLYHKEKVFIKSNEITDDCYRLLNHIEDCYAVIGVARSGIFPASFLSTISNSRLMSYENTNGTITDLKGGRRSNDVYGDGNNIYLVDDSSFTGKAMRFAKKRVQKHFPDKNIITMVLYSTEAPFTSGLIDHTARIVDKHYFEWHLFASPLCSKICIDFDGILCRDFMPYEEDDGPIYLQTLQSMSLGRVRPQSKWPVDIITARLEKWRKPTEEWLVKNQINYSNLIMGPWNNISERFNADIAEWKSTMYGNLPNKTLFVESDIRQATKIHSLTNKDVLHYDSGRLLSCTSIS